MTSTPAATAAPARPDTREMIVVHNVFRRLFGDLPGLISGVTAGDRARAAILGDACTEVATGLHHHHTNEDELLWPRSWRRVDADRGFVLRAEEQHRTGATSCIEPAGTPRSRRFAADARARHDRDALARDDAAELDAAMLRAHGRRGALHPAARRGAHDASPSGRSSASAVGASIPKDRLLIQLGWILEGLSPAEGKEFLHNMPFPARIAWRLLGKRAFGKEQRRVYGS